MPDIVDKFTTHLKNVLTRSLCLVVEQSEEAIEPEHLLWGLVTEQGSIGAEILRKGGLSDELLRGYLHAEDIEIGDAPRSTDPLPRLSEQSKRVIEKAVLTATVHEHHYVGTEHLVAGILQIGSPRLAQLFEQAHVDTEAMRKQLGTIMKGTQRFPDVVSHALGSDEKKTDAHTHDHDEDAESLSFFATELTERTYAEALDPVIGREEEVTRMMEILSRRTKNNPILIGEPGVGKTAIVEGLAKRIVEGTVPAALADKRLFALDLGNLIAGTVYRGEFEGRLKQIIDEVREQEDIILFIDEVHMIMGAGSASGSMDAANLLKPALARGWIRCIGATTPAEYKKHIEQDGALERRFQTITVEEPSGEETLTILQGLKERYEAFHHVTITDEAVAYAVKASQRYIHDQQLPDKAIDLIDEAAASLVVKRPTKRASKARTLKDELSTLRAEKREAILEERFLDAHVQKAKEEATEARLGALQKERETPSHGTVTPDVIAGVIERRTGIKATTLKAEERLALQSLSEQLKTVVFGQDTIIDAVTTHIRRAKTGVRSLERPLASFLFVGPSGTGKSELARQLSQHVFATDSALIRLDMSEYAEGYSVSKLIGSPAGYVGYREPAKLTDQVKAKPHSVILFDEIEKAHKDIHHLLLQILEHGELTDATGRSISFRNTIIILTSNTGAEAFARGAFGFDETRLSDPRDMHLALKDTFQSELLNRLDGIHVFEPLKADHLLQLVERELTTLKQHLAGEDIRLTWTKRVLKHLIADLPLEDQGARAVRRRVNEHLGTQIADYLLNHPTHQSVHARINKNGIDLTTKTR